MENITDVLNYDEDSNPTRYSAEDRDRFRITDDKQATWAMRKLMALRHRVEENEAVADAERLRIDEWLQYANQRYAGDIAYFEAILTMYAQQQRTTDGRKTIDTPYGAVKSRATQDKFKIVDEDVFLKWAEESLPDAIMVKRTPSVTNLKKAVTIETTETLGLVAMTEDGEIVPGVHVEAGSVSYTVEVSQ
jgi:hypothetical protein